MQATGGYMGRILVLDMTAKIAEVIDTDPYEPVSYTHLTLPTT